MSEVSEIKKEGENIEQSVNVEVEESEGKEEVSRQNVQQRFKYRKKFCRFCKGILNVPTYKDVEVLKKFISERGKILPARMTGNCAKHQRKLAKAIKQARILALLPFVVE